MKELIRELERTGCSDIQTYIQSGNVVFRSSITRTDKMATRISQTILKSHGFRPEVMVLSAKELEDAASSNPFPNAEIDPKSLHLYFLASAPDEPNLEALNKLMSSSESFEVLGSVVYLHAPEGIARSKLARSVEKVIGIDATARNWRTVTKLIDLARQPE